jgi:hypothetical protein
MDWSTKKYDEQEAVGKEGMKLLDDAFMSSYAYKDTNIEKFTWCRLGDKGYDYKSRFDRFFSNKKGISVCDGGYSLHGRTKLPGVDQTVGYETPSDHYGVMVRYMIVPDPNNSSSSYDSPISSRPNFSSSSFHSSHPSSSSPSHPMGSSSSLSANPNNKSSSSRRTNNFNSVLEGKEDLSLIKSEMRNKRLQRFVNTDTELPIPPSLPPALAVPISLLPSPSALHRSIPCPVEYDQEVWDGLPHDIQKELSA